MKSLSTTKRRSQRKLLIVIFIVTLLVLSAAAYIFVFSKKDADTNRLPDNESSSKQDENADQDNPSDTYVPPEEVVPPTEADAESSNSAKTHSTSDQSDSSGGIAITSTSIAGGHFKIRTMIDGITSSGQCNLSMKSTSGKTYTNSSGVQALPNSSTCKGFDVPLSSLSSEEWTITTTYTNAGRTLSASKKVFINDA